MADRQHQTIHPMHKLHALPFDNAFARLPEHFYARVQPTPLEDPYTVSVNKQAAALIDLDPAELAHPEFAHYFTGAKPLPGSEPLAMLYAGHQFGHWVPQLGDGRAILLGQVRNQQGETWDLQLKGAGLTPFSRGGDGRAVLRSTIREYLCAEAMHGLGIPTTRSLCMTGSDEEVYREQIETGAMLLRMAPSHVRFGSFEVFYHRGQYDRLKELADHVIAEHYPELADTPRPYAAFLQEVVRRTGRLMAQWQLVGFAHGVMNTDNMSVLGLTMDYGPFGFLDAYDPDFICNHSDHGGRYRFDAQPSIGLWNLSAFAQALLPLLNAEDGEAAAEEARDILKAYEPELVRTYARGMRDKLGLRESRDGDQSLSAGLLELMHKSGSDYTNAFRALGWLKLDDTGSDAPLRDQFIDRAAFDAWASNYRNRLRAEQSDDARRRARMQRTNPKYVLRNWLAQRAIDKAQDKDFSEIDRLLGILQAPFDEHPDHADCAAPPPDWAKGISVSCSS
jgi:uncharacterized protein YdiU (UPF0061 family)